MDLNGKRIMIANCCGLGDLIMFTPALRRLKEKFPTCNITFLYRDNNRAVLEGLPYIDKVVCIYHGKFLGRYISIPELFRQDVIIFMEWQPVTLFFAKILRVPIRVGFGIFDALEIPLDGDMTKIEVSPPKAEDIQSVNSMLEVIGLESDSKYILLMQFTGFELRNLPLTTAKEFIDEAERRYKLPVVIAGPSSKQAESQKLSRYTLTGATTLSELIEIISRAEILVTPDSGQMYVAGAVGTKCVALFTKDLPSRWASKRNCIPIYLKLPCSPCNDATALACPHVKCMRGITVEMILNACDRFLLENV